MPNTFSRLLSLHVLSLGQLRFANTVYYILEKKETFKVMSDTQPVNQFFDLEARVDDTSDQEEGDSDSDSASFSILIYTIVFLHIRITSQGFP